MLKVFSLLLVIFTLYFQTSNAGIGTGTPVASCHTQREALIVQYLEAKSGLSQCNDYLKELETYLHQEKELEQQELAALEECLIAQLGLTFRNQVNLPNTLKKGTGSLVLQNPSQQSTTHVAPASSKKRHASSLFPRGVSTTEILDACEEDLVHWNTKIRNLNLGLQQCQNLINKLTIAAAVAYENVQDYTARLQICQNGGVSTPVPTPTPTPPPNSCPDPTTLFDNTGTSFSGTAYEFYGATTQVGGTALQANQVFMGGKQDTYLITTFSVELCVFPDVESAESVNFAVVFYENNPETNQPGNYISGVYTSQPSTITNGNCDTLTFTLPSNIWFTTPDTFWVGITLFGGASVDDLNTDFGMAVTATDACQVGSANNIWFGSTDGGTEADGNSFAVNNPVGANYNESPYGPSFYTFLGC